MARRFTANGSVGNIREIYVSGCPECAYEARFDGGILGYYNTEDDAYRAIQEALAARLAEANELTKIERMRRGK